MSNSSIWPIDRALSGLLLQATVNLEVIVMKAYSALSKNPLLEPLHHFVLDQEHSLRESYPSEEMMLVYSTSTADWALRDIKLV